MWGPIVGLGGNPFYGSGSSALLPLVAEQYLLRCRRWTSGSKRAMHYVLERTKLEVGPVEDAGGRR
jgi:hypothetical protein